VSVDDVGNFKPCDTDMPNARHLIVEVVPFNVLLTTNVREDAVALPLANVERIAIARVDEAVNIGLKFLDDFGRKCINRCYDP
jgi:hypothetical protein